MRIFWIVAMFLALSLQSKPALGQGIAQPRVDLKVDDATFRDVAGDLRCPTCTGLSVLDSDASFSVQIKNEVKEQLNAGKSKDEILEFFTQRYGPWILRAPPKEGIHMWAWLLPIAALVLGPIIIWMVVWSRRERASSDEVLTRPVDEVVKDMHQRLATLRHEKGVRS